MKTFDMSKTLRVIATAVLSTICANPAAWARDPSPNGATPPQEETTALEEKLAAQLRLLAALYIEDNEPDKAIACYETIAELHPGDPRALEELTDICFRYESYDKAKPALEKLNRLKPDNPVALHELAKCHKEAGNAEKYIALFKKALAINPNSKEAHLETAIRLEQYGLMEAVYAELEKTLAIPSKKDKEDYDIFIDGRALEKMAYYLEYEGKYKEAANFYRRLLPLMELYDLALPGGIPHATLHLYYCEGKQFAREGKLDEARDKFERAIRAFEDIDARGALYLCLKKQGKDKEAGNFFKETEKLLNADLKGDLPPDALSNALNALAWFYAVTGEKTDEGLRLARRAVELAPHDAPTLDTLAELYYQKEDYENAVKYGKMAHETPKSRNVPYFRRQYEKMKKALEESRPRPAEGKP